MMMMNREDLYIAPCPMCGSKMVYSPDMIRCAGEYNSKCAYTIKSEQLDQHNALYKLLEDTRAFIEHSGAEVLCNCVFFQKLQKSMGDFYNEEEKGHM